jgi:hypothetical protein
MSTLGGVILVSMGFTLLVLCNEATKQKTYKFMSTSLLSNNNLPADITSISVSRTIALTARTAIQDGISGQFESCSSFPSTDEQFGRK